MFNINLNNVFTVEQVNHEVDRTKAPENWENSSDGGISDVVDPNTEFQLFDRSSAPASPLASYGFPTPPQTPSVFNKIAGPIQHPESSYLRACSKPAITKVLNSSSEIPQVHAYVSSTKMAHNSMNYRQQSTIQIEPDMIPYPQSDISIVKEHRSYLSPTPSKEEMNMTSVTTSTPKNSTNRSQMRRSFSIEKSPVPVVDRATTSDQIAWAMRSARDRLETASNMSGCSSRFELDSNCSDRADTMSTYSDVSGYEEELFRIRRLLLQQDSSSSFLDKHLEKHSTDRKHSIVDIEPSNSNSQGIHTSLDAYKENTEFQIRKLNSQLQAALAEKEMYRVERNEASAKSALEWQQKFQEILRQKANTDGRLETLQAEVNTIRGSTVDKLRVAEMRQEKGEMESELDKLRHMYRDCEAKRREQCLQLELLESEVSRWRAEAQDSDSANEGLRVQLQELRVDTEMKDGAIQGLKMKVADQHVELQSLLQAKLKAENSIVAVKNDADTIRKSGTWYKEQLHACQSAKVKVQQELMTSQANVVSYSHLVEKLKLEAANLRSITEETQQRAVREKDALMRKLEKIHADMLEREATLLNQLRREDTTVEAIAAKLSRTEKSRETEMNFINEELEQNIGILRIELKEKEDKIKRTELENGSLVQRMTNVQKIMNEKELTLQSLQVKYKNVEMSNNSVTEILRSKEKSLMDLKNEKVVLEVALSAAAREKKEVDLAIEKLRDDVARITKSYQVMRVDVGAKEREIENLHTELQKVKTVKEQQIEIISCHEKELDQWKDMQAKIAEFGQLEIKLSCFKDENDELNRKIREMSEAKDYTSQEMDKLRETLTFREEQLFNQTRSFEVHAEEIKSRDSLISTLTADKRSLLDSLEELHSKIAQSENVALQKSKEVELTNEQLARCNFVIEQFNTLCRGSELENHQLKQLMKELEAVPIVSNIARVTSTTQTVPIIAIDCTSQTTEEQPSEHILSQSTQLQQDLKKELEQLKCSLRMSDIEKRDKQRRYETNIRTLLKKVKEHMRGRKVAEKALTELESNTSNSIPLSAGGDMSVDVAALRIQVTRLEAELELGQRQYQELKKITDRSEETVLELEKERGRLGQVQTATANTVPEATDHSNETCELSRIKELEEEVRKQQIIVKDLKKEIFNDRRDNSQLRKQVSSLRMGLDTANDVLDNKKIDLGRSEAMSEVLRNTIACLQRELEKEQVTHEECKQVVEKLKMELEETRSKDPMLADQIKMLSYHLHEKSREASTLQEQRLLSEERWSTTENGLKQSMGRLRDEITMLREELDVVRADKFTLQAQTVELRAALQSSLDQYKLLRLKSNPYESAPNNEKALPDLTSSLPLAPTKYDESEIAELLQPSGAMPHNQPLNNLQSCLDQLKQEMATLQEQLIAKTSHHAVKGSNSVHEI